MLFYSILFLLLGSGPTGTEEIKSHPFFAAINWDKLYKKEINPPYRPPVHADETYYFDREFTSRTPRGNYKLKSFHHSILAKYYQNTSYKMKTLGESIKVDQLIHFLPQTYYKSYNLLRFMLQNE